MKRMVRWLLAGAVAVAGLVGVAAPAKSTGPCGYVRTHSVTSTSVSIVAYCNNPDHWRCDPGFPAIGPSNLGVASFFFCLDHPPD